MNLSNILKEQHITQPVEHKPRFTEDGHYYWLKGETIKLTWDVDGDIKNDADNTYVDVVKFMEDKTVKVKMFDYMGQKIREWTLDRPGIKIEILIDNNDKIDDYFARDLSTGTYQFSITVCNHFGMVLELVKRSDCIVEVR